MARSERAKELEARQKAEAKALREAKRNSDDPRDWGTWRQIRESYKMTRQYDPQLPWLLFGSMAAIIAICVVISIFVWDGRFNWLWGLLMGIMLALTAGMYLLTNRTKKATFARYKNEQGSGAVGLNLLNKRKWHHEVAIAFTRQGDTIHRAIGPAGVVLIGDGNPNRLKQMLTSEARRHEQVLYDVPVHIVQIGEADDQVKLEDLAKHIEKLPKAIDKVQIEDVNSRLRALNKMKPKVPLPKGPLPNAKGARRMMRGR